MPGTIKVMLPNPAGFNHLQMVKQQMKKKGPPVIRIIWHPQKNAYFALEGSHRLTAAKELGLKPVFKDMTGKKRIWIKQLMPFRYQSVTPAKLFKHFWFGISPVLEFEKD
jgi:hypothetical protein